MGDYYYRMRLATNDIAEVKRLMHEQAYALRQSGQLGSWLNQLFNPDYPETQLERDAAWERFGNISLQLEELLEFEPYYDNASNTIWPLVGSYDIFPPEWRLNAYRSFAPDEIEPQLTQWISYLEEVRQGQHRAYLLRWFIFVSGETLVEYWEYLQAGLKSVLERDNVWVRRLKESGLSERILAAPKPRNHPAPIWAEWQDSASTRAENDQLFSAFQKEQADFMKLFKEWNYIVPSKKQYRYYPRPFEELLATANAILADNFVVKMKKCVADGVGLYYTTFVPRVLLNI
ncbi:MAG: hypothetical protein F9K46_06325 [Anaerolineae bacterium]|nr:MAG: hypothetical protein F9K46_06325 [Anaerolineae bacterium]